MDSSLLRRQVTALQLDGKGLEAERSAAEAVLITLMGR